MTNDRSKLPTLENSFVKSSDDITSNTDDITNQKVVINENNECCDTNSDKDVKNETCTNSNEDSDQSMDTSQGVAKIPLKVKQNLRKINTTTEFLSEDVKDLEDCNLEEEDNESDKEEDWDLDMDDNASNTEEILDHDVVDDVDEGNDSKRDIQEVCKGMLPIPSHPIPSHPFPSHPIPSHPFPFLTFVSLPFSSLPIIFLSFPFHPIPFHPNPFLPIPSYPISPLPFPFKLPWLTKSFIHDPLDTKQSPKRHKDMDVSKILKKKYIIKETSQIATVEAVESQSLKRKRQNNSGKPMFR